MVKANRDMRALHRNLFKIKKELAKTERNATTRTKTMSAARNRAFCTLEQENKILLKSVQNFNIICNNQKKTIRVLEHGLDKLQKASKELQLLKKSLQSIECKRNPHIYRKANI